MRETVSFCSKIVHLHIALRRFQLLRQEMPKFKSPDLLLPDSPDLNQVRTGCVSEANTEAYGLLVGDSDDLKQRSLRFKTQATLLHRVVAKAVK